MISEALLALSLLLAPVPPADVAPPTFQVPVNSPLSVNSQFIGADGKLYTFKGDLIVSGTLVLTIEEPPPPPVTQITALRNAAGQGVESIQVGETLIIEGVQLWQQGTSLRVQIPGRTAVVLSATPTKLMVRFPAVAVPMDGPLQVYWNDGTGWTLKTQGPRIKVLPLVLSEFRLDGFATPDGTPVDRLDPMAPFVIRGEGFGPQPGEVRVGHREAMVLSWSDTEILVGGYRWHPERGFGSSTWWRESVSIWRVDWEQSYTLWQAVWMLEPGQEPSVWPVVQNR